MLVCVFLPKNKTAFTRLAPPLTFSSSQNLRHRWKESDFAAIEEIKEKSKQELWALPKSAFPKCFEDWKNAGISVVYLRGDYFEGDKIVIVK